MTNPIGILHQLASASIEKCLLRLSRVSAGTWQVRGINVFAGTIEDAIKQHDFKNPAAAVYFKLGEGAGLSALMLFDPCDMECISKGFTGHCFPRGPHTTPAEEIILLELGNIVMNAPVNSVLNALKKSSIPAVPQFVEGDAARLIQVIGAAGDAEKVFRVIKIVLIIRCDKWATFPEVYLMIPEELASALELAEKV